MGLVRRGAEAALAEAQRRRLGIRAPGVETPVISLSGGNQQKVVLAKWLAMRPRAIIFDEPTRGIDVGAKQEIYDMMRGLADAGVAVLMISSDMEEVIGVSDRIAVMHEGGIGGVLERPAFSEHAVLELAVGHALMQKKDFGLLVLILVVGAVVALINPRFLSPINLANTANLVGLFGLFAIGQGFVIITGGIELVGRLGDRAARRALRRPRRELRRALAGGVMLAMLALGVLIGLAHGLLITRLGMQPFIVTLCGLLIYRGVARFYTADATAGLRLRPDLSLARMGDDRPELRRAALLRRHAGDGGDHVGGAAPLGLRALPLRGRQERGGGALCRRADRQGHRRGLRDLRGPDGDRRDLLRDVHPLDLAGLARQLLRALRHRRRGARRLLACAAARGR